MSKHTKGPWVYKPAMAKGTNDEILSSDVVIAIIKNHLNPSNANLIAAAPELLEALEDAVTHHDDFFKSSTGHAELPWVAPARAAIAKAKGEQA